jgi:hypothetical protein
MAWTLDQGRIKNPVFQTPGSKPTMPGEREGLAKKPTTPLSYSLKGTHMLESGWLPLMAHWEQSKWGDRGRSIASTSAVDDRGLRSSPPAAASELFFFPTILDLTALLHSRESSSLDTLPTILLNSPLLPTPGQVVPLPSWPFTHGCLM